MVDAVLGLIGTLLYPLFSIVFVIISILQSLFYSFAGIGDNIQYGSTYSGNGETGMGFIPITGSSSDGGDTSTGIVYFILNSNIVKNIFISIAILAIFLIIIFSTLAALKSIYSEKPKSWRDIVTNAVKGLTSFIILPVCCLLGVWVGNILLQAVAGATSQGGTMYLDRQLFLSCSYSANIYRIETFTDSAGDKKKQDAAYERIKETIEIYGLTNAYGGEVDATDESGNKLTDEEGNTIKNLKNLKRGQNSEYYAQIVDQMYGLNRIPIHNHITVGVGESGHQGYYQLWNINYLLLIVGGIFMMYVLVSVTYGMVKRLFILMMLFVISPAVCAMYPLDEGNAVKNWTGDVRKNITSAYGAVAGMNLFFCFAPVIKNINFSLSGAAWASDIFFVSDIIQLILLICGLFCVNEFITMIVNYFGLGNAYSDGKSLRASATGALKNYGGKATKRTAGAFVRGNNARKETGGFKGVLRGAGAFFDEAALGGLGKDAMKGAKDAKKDGRGAFGGFMSGAMQNLGKYGSGVSGEIGKVLDEELKKGKDESKQNEKKAKWAQRIANIDKSEFVGNEGAMASELKRQMLADGIKEEDLFDKRLLGDEAKFGKKDAVNESIARFNEKDYDERKIPLESVRTLISSSDSTDAAQRAATAAAKAFAEELDKKQALVVSADASGRDYVTAVNNENLAEAAATAAAAAATTAVNNYHSFRSSHLSNTDIAQRRFIGEEGKYTADEMKGQTAATIRDMKEFNRLMDEANKAKRDEQEASKNYANATTAANEALNKFTADLDKAKSISSDAATAVTGFSTTKATASADVTAIITALTNAVNRL